MANNMINTAHTNGLSIQTLFLAITISMVSVGAAVLPTHQAQATNTVDFSNLVEQVTPGVARVSVTKELGGDAYAQAQIPELLKRFFGNQIQIPNQPRLQRGYGSAFFVTQDGYMLTNNHVVEGADKITITLNDRRELDAKLIGTDPRTDVAVLKVSGHNYPALSIGDSQNLKVGEPVLAIGSPFGFDYSASAGIVSAKSRSFSSENAVPFIQTDVALNPGNSGGPLFNQYGQVVGINSRIFSGTGGYMGLSFSIPIDVAMDIYSQIKNTGHVSRAYLGVFPQDLDRNLAEAYGFKRPKGALITQVSPDSGAAKAGIKAGDIILAFNDIDIDRAADLINLINRAKPDDSFRVTVQRDGNTQQLKGKLGAAPDEADEGLRNHTSDNTPTLGLKLRVLTTDEKARIEAQGLLITAIEPTGLADKAGLKAGDVITKLNRQATPNIAAFIKANKDLPKKGVVLVNIIRQGMPMVIGLRIE